MLYSERRTVVSLVRQDLRTRGKMPYSIGNIQDSFCMPLFINNLIPMAKFILNDGSF